MAKKELITSLREQIAVNKTDTALEALINFLSNASDHYDELEKTAQLISSDFHRLRQEQMRDTIDPEDYNRELNKVQARILGLLEDLEKGRLQPSENPVPKSSPKYLLYLLAGAALVVIGLWLGGVFQTGNTNNPLMLFDPMKLECPNFQDSSAFQLLILPLKSLDNTQADFSNSIKSGLDDILKSMENQSMRVSIKVHEAFQAQHYDLPSFTEAAAIGNKCMAKMIIWGAYEKHNDSYRVHIKYNFLGDDTKLKLHKLEASNSELTVVDAISSVQNEDFLTGDISRIIDLVMGIMAHKENRRDVATSSLTKAIAEGKLDSATLAKSEKLLADNLMMDTSSLQKASYRGAIDIYSKILEQHPENLWALNNRGLLYYELQEYDKAIQDFDLTINANKTDSEEIGWLMVRRSNAHILLGDFQKAQDDLVRAQPLLPDSFQKAISRRLNMVAKGEIPDRILQLDVQKTRAPQHPKIMDGL